MTTLDRDRWNEKYARREPPATVEPDEWLLEATAVIERAPEAPDVNRRALDLACGLGHNAIWLTQQGWQTDAVDISHRGLELARQCAAANNTNVRWIEADLDDWMPAPNQYDLVIVFRYLDRATIPRVVRTALRPGGWLVFETFSTAQCQRHDNHIRNPSFTLAAGDFQALFPDFDTLVCREDVLRDRTVWRLLGRRRLELEGHTTC